jgi:hypothetical protein
MSAESDPRDVVSLRGPAAQSIGRRFWTSAAAVLLALLAVIVVVTFVSAVNDNARIDRLKTHGEAVIVTVTNCVGNLGGSGSNAADYTCQGTYRLNGTRYQETIGSKTSFSSPGDKIRAVADPARPSTIEVATAVATSSSSASVYVVPSLLAVLLVGLALVYVRRLLPTTKRGET